MILNSDRAVRCNEDAGGRTPIKGEQQDNGQLDTAIELGTKVVALSKLDLCCNGKTAVCAMNTVKNSGRRESAFLVTHRAPLQVVRPYCI